MSHDRDTASTIEDIEPVRPFASYHNVKYKLTFSVFNT